MKCKEMNNYNDLIILNTLFKKYELTKLKYTWKHVSREDKEKIKEILRNDFKDYKDKNIDSIVLGCTHYPFIKKEILEEMPGVSLIDGFVGVAKEVKRQLEEHGLLNDERNRTITIYNSLTNKEEVSSN